MHPFFEDLQRYQYAIALGMRVFSASPFGPLPWRPQFLSILFALTTLALSGCPSDCVIEGSTHAVGETFEAPDGCNTCTCEAAGAVSCTERGCVPSPDAPDGGSAPPSVDGGPQSGETDAGPGPQLPADRPEPCLDLDNDGFFACYNVPDGFACDCTDANHPEDHPQTDCDDTRWFVQPLGYEYPGNGIDDNCNDLTDAEETAPCACDSGASGGDALLAAMDLCDPSVSTTLTTGNGAQLGVFPDYFGDVQPQNGACVAVLSTGNADGTDGVQPGTDFSDFLVDAPFPDPAPVDPGANVYDLAQLKVTLRPPPNAKGIEFDFMFMSAEWPEFLCQEYNDTFYTVLQSQEVNGGERTNISFDPQGREITVNVGFFESPRQWTTSLTNTPFGAADEFGDCSDFALQEQCALPGYCPAADLCTPGCNAGEVCVDLDASGNYACRAQEVADLHYIGSGSGWLVTRAPISPNEETITLTFSVHDEFDAVYDSLVVLDNLHWVPFSPPVGTVPKPLQ